VDLAITVSLTMSLGTLVGILTIAGFLWKFHREVMSIHKEVVNIREQIAKLEANYEDMREQVGRIEDILMRNLEQPMKVLVELLIQRLQRQSKTQHNSEILLKNHV